MFLDDDNTTVFDNTKSSAFQAGLVTKIVRIKHGSRANTGSLISLKKQFFEDEPQSKIIMEDDDNEDAEVKLECFQSYGLESMAL